MGWFLRVGNIVVAKMLQLFFNAPSLSDCGCTLRLVRRDVAAQLRDRLTVTESHFLPDMMIAALKQQVKIIEIPVNYRGRIGESKITGSFKGAWKTGLRMIMLILRQRFLSRS
jgi:hypothetical protein